MSEKIILKLEEVAEQLQMVNDESDIFYNTETGEFVYNSPDFPDNEIDFDDLEDEKYIALPSQRDIGEYGIMSDFADSVRDSHKRDLLCAALEGKGAFRRFKDTLVHAGLQEQWYEFRDRVFLLIAKEWCEENGIPFQECDALAGVDTEETSEKFRATYAKPSVSLVTLESRNHIIGDIERGVKVYKQGGVEFEEREPGFYLARVPHKNDFKMVSLNFSRDGQYLEQHYCHCTADDKNPPVCRHVVAAVLAIQGGAIDSGITLGKKGTAETIVAANNIAKAVGSGSLDVFSTPMMIALMEQAACNALSDVLEDGQTSVGTAIEIKHTATTPLGMKVTATAIIESVNGRNIIFAVSAADESSEIGSGTHIRAITDAERFMKKVNGKKPSE